ncbi:hypothetical protein K431DRAFT_67847 [Polychaeton citri CBS 116435]|uniref:Uncharacterized protein n=1 Tax=Polychaeton citri CBS 116435 TaxID=1314669 RepID=A0A9P4QB99_9PEZI|nr:hypothetical protein K431DRAFT_67847 [Polychaeton citri CBS 116435]
MHTHCPREMTRTLKADKRRSTPLLLSTTTATTAVCLTWISPKNNANAWSLSRCKVVLKTHTSCKPLNKGAYAI